MRFGILSLPAVLALALVLCLALFASSQAKAQSLDCAGGSCATAQGSSLRPALPGQLPAPLPAPFPYANTYPSQAVLSTSQSFVRTSYFLSGSPGHSGPPARNVGLLARGAGVSRGAVRRIGRVITAPLRLCH